MFYSYERFVKDIQEILNSLKFREFEPDYVIALTKGGVIPATILSSRLDRPLFLLSEDDNYLTSKNTANFTIGYKVLLVTDYIGYMSRDNIRFLENVFAIFGNHDSMLVSLVSYDYGVPASRKFIECNTSNELVEFWWERI